MERKINHKLEKTLKEKRFDEIKIKYFMIRFLKSIYCVNNFENDLFTLPAKWYEWKLQY